MPSQPPANARNCHETPAFVADVGGSHVTAAAVQRGAEPRILERVRSEIETQGDADSVLGSITAVLREVAQRASAWTVALPGPFDYRRGVGSFEGVSKFQSLAGLDLGARLSSMLDLPRNAIRFVNDAVAYGVGEWSVSPTRPDRFVCLTLGTGVGSAFLDRGHPVDTGDEVPPHGWAHLLEVDGRPLEDFVSTRAVQRRYAAEGGGSSTVREIAERARRGDERARTVLEAAMLELGETIAPWIARFGASETVVGGSMARSWDVLGPAFERGVSARGVTVSIRPSRLFDDAPLIGSAMLD